MAKTWLFGVFLVLLALGCSTGMEPGGAGPADSLPTPAVLPAEGLPASPPEDLPQASQPVAVTPQPAFTAAATTPGEPAPSCAGGETNPIAASIAADYPFTGYEEVMGWFCDGAEFEDILSALMTEELTGTPAEEMLAMLAEGFTWDEIWQVTGLTE